MNNVYLDKILYIKFGNKITYFLPDGYCLRKNGLYIYKYSVRMTKIWLKSSASFMKVYDLNNKLIKINKNTRIYEASKRTRR